jgi:hypothetical protein
MTSSKVVKSSYAPPDALVVGVATCRPRGRLVGVDDLRPRVVVPLAVTGLFDRERRCAPPGAAPVPGQQQRLDLVVTGGAVGSAST